MSTVLILAISISTLLSKVELLMHISDRSNVTEPRILVVGDYMWPWYQEACAEALERHGCNVKRFSWFDDFWHWKEGCNEPFYRSFNLRMEYRLRLGPTIWRVGRRLLAEANAYQPDIIWFYNVQLMPPRVVRALKKSLPSAVFVQYANDNPFSATAKMGSWRHYLKSIPLFDIHFAYRWNNVADYQQYGAESVHLLRSYFIPEVDYPVPHEKIPERFMCDVVFAGHYEDDGRVDMLEAICDAGYELNLFGGGWDLALSRLGSDSPLRKKYPIRPATKENYRYAISGAKVALCFLSTLNHDTYTRRSFQIPSMKVAMLSQHTDDLATLYKADREAVFFRNTDELLNKLSKLISDPQWRESVAEAGYAKVYADGHDVFHRMSVWLGEVQKNSPIMQQKSQ